MEEANDVIILSAISKGAKKFDKIEKVTKITGKDLNDMLERLEKNGMITIVEKKGLFGTKKEIVLTQKGTKELEERKFELEKEWDQMVTMWKGGDKQKLQQYMENKKSLLPSMMFLGIMDILMFSTMMSFMGMAMSSYIPQEQIPADAGAGAESTDSGDTGSDFSGGDGGGGFDIDIGF
ncbi:MAG TPA: winged helix-turn-helix transcriptional regulator [Nitrosopumilaceae archaeon]|nr:winged helix-turn-helix transcriptional regulator [Nitrosopumilaceae archaeon]